MNESQPYGDLGEAWLRHQTTRIRHRHFQFRRHLRLDVAELLDRAARLMRASRGARGQPAMPTQEVHA